MTLPAFNEGMTQPMKHATPRALRLALDQPDLARIFHNTAWLFADRLIRAGLTLVVSVWLARYLGAAGYGIYSYAFAMIALFSSIASAGLEDLVVRELVKAPSRRGEIIGTTFALKTAFGILAGGLSVATIAFVRPDEPMLLGLTAIIASGFLFEAFQTLSLWFQSQTQSKYDVIARSASLILINLVKIGLLLSVATIHAFAWAALVESILVAAALSAIYRLKGNGFHDWRINLGYAATLLRESLPLALSSLVVIAYGRLAQLMMGGMSGNEAVGIYSAASRISEAWTFIPLAIIASTFPSLVSAKSSNPALYARRLQTLCNVIVLLAIAVAIPMTFLATPLVLALFGEAYIEAGPVLAINFWGGVFLVLSMLQSSWYVSEGLTRLALVRTLLCALLNAALNAVLIPRYSYTGGALATAIAYAVNACVLNLTDARTRPYFVLQLKALTFRAPLFRWSEP